MKNIEVEDDLYRYIASHTEDIGEGASTILRRLLGLPTVGEIEVDGPLIPPTDVRAKSLASLRKQTLEVVQEVSAACGIKPNFTTLLKPENLGEQKAAVGRFLFLLNELHDLRPTDFNKVLEISGRDRVYFATDEQSLLGKNGSTKPKQIGQTDYWVITNSNTGKKRSMLTNALTAIGCDEPLAVQIAEQI